MTGAGINHHHISIYGNLFLLLLLRLLLHQGNVSFVTECSSHGWFKSLKNLTHGTKPP